MRWVDVPSLEVHRSAQNNEPLGGGLVRFRSGGFAADIRFDETGLVLAYPGIAKRLLVNGAGSCSRASRPGGRRA
jgi:hypothetical protein